jgi:hypothetical protein
VKQKKSAFPISITDGSVTAKIYKVRNLFYTVRLKSGKVKHMPRFSYKVSYFAEGQRFQKLIADLAERAQSPCPEKGRGHQPWQFEGPSARPP